MTHRPRLFLDTCVLFAAVLSPSGGSRLLLKLGEARVVRPVVGRRVLTEADGVMGRKAPGERALLALLLDRANAEVGPEPTEADMRLARSVMEYRPDAHVLAEALASGADRFVTLDRKHFLGQPELDDLPIVVEEPGDSLAWLRGRLFQAEP